MPLIHKWETEGAAVAAIWKVEEARDFFLNDGTILATISHQTRLVEHHAGRFLLQYLAKDLHLPDIMIDEHGKPRIDGLHFSISHSFPYVAVIVDEAKETGIDIQVWRPNMTRIQDKFLSLEEQQFFVGDEKRITAAWCAKEAAYKCIGKKGVDFIRDLNIVYCSIRDTYCVFNLYTRYPEIPQMLTICAEIQEEYACAYIVSAENWLIY
jgi:4'-phosphopantetheinyl transferase